MTNLSKLWYKNCRLWKWLQFSTQGQVLYLWNNEFVVVTWTIKRIFFSHSGFHKKDIWHISVRLSDRSQVMQHKINFIKNCPQWGLNPWPSDHQSHALINWARQESVTDFWSEHSFVSYTTSHAGLFLFLESIQHDFTKALMIHTDNQIVT